MYILREVGKTGGVWYYGPFKTITEMAKYKRENFPPDATVYPQNLLPPNWKSAGS